MRSFRNYYSNLPILERTFLIYDYYQFKASFCLPTTYLCILYFCLVIINYGLVYPYLDLVYCISVWGSTYPSNLTRIFLLQKKVIRIISKSAFDAHTEPIFKQLKILKLGKFMFSFKKGLLPDAFSEMFLLTNQIHHYNTRNSNSFYLFSCRTNIRQLAIRFQGPKLFNSFSTEIQNADSFSQFKSKLKTFLLN